MLRVLDSQITVIHARCNLQKLQLELNTVSKENEYALNSLKSLYLREGSKQEEKLGEKLRIFAKKIDQMEAAHQNQLNEKERNFDLERQKLKLAFSNAEDERNDRMAYLEKENQKAMLKSISCSAKRFWEYVHCILDGSGTEKSSQ